MPPASPSGIQRPRQRNLTAILFGAVFAVVLGIVVFAVLFAVTEKSTKQTAGRPYIVGRAEDLAESVAEHGPLLLPDLASGQRAIFVNHLGANNWAAFESTPPGAAATCQLRWQPGPRHFRDECENRTYPADGAGLVTYPTSVDDEGRLVVDLRTPASPTTAPPSTTAPPAVGVVPTTSSTPTSAA